MDLPPDALRALRLAAFGLFLGPVFFLGIGLFLRISGTTLGSVEPLLHVAVAFAVASPLVAGFLRHQIVAPFGDGRLPLEKARQAVIVPFALLETAAFLCGVALLLTPTYWPLFAATVPLAAMLAWFPRAD